VPRDAAASVSGVLGCAWHGRRGAGARARCRDATSQRRARPAKVRCC
jgi:hypothetical protein